jgi:hypothetical protein
MAAVPRALKKLGAGAVIGTYTVAASQTVRAGMPVILSGSDTAIDEAIISNDLCIGVALGTPGTSYAAAAVVQVLHYGPIVPVLVGTGDATRGKKAVVSASADGMCDCAAHDSDGTGNQNVQGVFMQSGVATEHVGMMMVMGNRGS